MNRIYYWSELSYATKYMAFDFSEGSLYGEDFYYMSSRIKRRMKSKTFKSIYLPFLFLDGDHKHIDDSITVQYVSIR